MMLDDPVTFAFITRCHCEAPSAGRRAILLASLDHCCAMLDRIKETLVESSFCAVSLRIPEGLGLSVLVAALRASHQLNRSFALIPTF
jgi:hypothetical protein